MRPRTSSVLDFHAERLQFVIGLPNFLRSQGEHIESSDCVAMRCPRRARCARIVRSSVDVCGVE